MADYLVDLGENEHIVAEVRRHMFVFYTRITGVVFLIFLPLVFTAPIVQFLNGRFLETGLSAQAGGGAFFTFLYLLWFLVLFVVFFFQWTDYYLDVWVLTTERIFDVEQRGAFNRQISVFRLEQIQDVTVEVSGVLATFLKYGDIHIHTAGEAKDFIIRDAADPLYIKKVIMEEHGKVIRARTDQGVDVSE
ncbi:PH domain-containing protein [Candidatus Wolfebacteria bacterium]|nr:PH domain-containing protein [Candidatus Wolfebacteria bacterium]